MYYRFPWQLIVRKQPVNSRCRHYKRTSSAPPAWGEGGLAYFMVLGCGWEHFCLDLEDTTRRLLRYDVKSKSDLFLFGGFSVKYWRQVLFYSFSLALLSFCVHGQIGSGKFIQWSSIIQVYQHVNLIFPFVVTPAVSMESPSWNLELLMPKTLSEVESLQIISISFCTLLYSFSSSCSTLSYLLWDHDAVRRP